MRFPDIFMMHLEILSYKRKIKRAESRRGQLQWNKKPITSNKEIPKYLSRIKKLINQTQLRPDEQPTSC